MKQILSDVLKHLKDDKKTFKEESSDDTKLIKKIKGAAMKQTSKKMEKAGKKAAKTLKKEVAAGKKEEKVAKVMREFKAKKLHSSSKKGPIVKEKSQAIAIALSEARKAAKKKSKK